MTQLTGASSPENARGSLRARWNQTYLYVEKKTRECAVPVGRRAEGPIPIGAGFAEIGFILESLRSSSSTLRCSCRGGRLVCVIALILSRR